MLAEATSPEAELARRELERRQAESDPSWFLDQVRMVDERTAEEFRFHLEDTEENKRSGWYWQRGVLLALIEFARVIILKARQLGITWLAAGYLNLWVPLYKPGSLTLIYRQTETEAQEILERVWEMWESLERVPWLRNDATVIKPAPGFRPSNVIVWKFPNGRISETRAMASTSSAGHGRTVAAVLGDEFSRIERAGEVQKSVQPAVGTKGKFAIVSTANGTANLETGEGNLFHYLYENAEASGFHRIFLPYNLHPDRDETWYTSSPEIIGLRPHERAEQYPADEHEAFTLTNLVFFDVDAMNWYRDHLKDPLYRCDFQKVTPTQAKLVKRSEGRISVYKEPEAGHNYGIGADAATARGRDFSAATLIDLATLEVCADFHGRIDPDQYAYQLHYLGRWFNTAWLAVEMGGGYGDAVQNTLRTGIDGRPHYPKLYVHVLDSRIDQPHTKVYGYPMTGKTRPQATGYFESLIREHALPYLTRSLLLEMQHFVEWQTGPSPRAAEGTRDDRVMSACVAYELFRRYGTHPDRTVPKQSKYRPQYPWQTQSRKKSLVRDRFRTETDIVDRDGIAVKRRREASR